MIEGVEELGTKFHMKPLAHVEHFASGQVCALLSRTLKDIFSCIAVSVAGGVLEVIDVEPHVDARMGEMAAPDLLRAQQSLRAGVSWVETD